MITLELPFPQSVNNYKKMGRITRTKTGKIYQARIDSPETKLFYWQVWAIVGKLKLKSFGSALLSMEVDVYPPDARRRDI
jgi:hypothetical protein